MNVSDKQPPKKHAPKPPDILRKSGPHEDKRRKEKHRKDYRRIDTEKENGG